VLASLDRVQQALAARTFTPATADSQPQQPLPAALLEAVRRRNAVLDGIFYDVGVLTEQESRDLSPWLAAEGPVARTTIRAGCSPGVPFRRPVRQ